MNLPITDTKSDGNGDSLSDGFKNGRQRNGRNPNENGLPSLRCVHRDNEQRIVAPTIPIHSLKACGLTQGVPPYDPAKEAKTQEWR